MANKDWPRIRDSRTNFLSGRSRTISNLRSLQMENRQREARLSLGAGIRDLERRTSEVPAILRNNLHNVIEELRPIMERARSVDSTTVPLPPWLNAPHQPAITSPRDSIPREPNTSNTDDVVIDVEGIDLSSPGGSNSGAQNINNINNHIPSPTGSAPSEISGASNHTNNTAANEDGEENILLTANDSVVLNTIVRYFPFITLVATKFIFDHIPGILLFVGLCTTFCYYNALVKREIARQTPRTKWMLMLFICLIMIAIAGLAYVIYNEIVLSWNFGITPQSEYPTTLADLLWSIIVTDFILKIITVVVKALFTLIPQAILPASKRFYSQTDDLRMESPLPSIFMDDNSRKRFLRSPQVFQVVLLTIIVMLTSYAVDWVQIDSYNDFSMFRGKYYLFIEATSQFYRGCMPINPWLHYLLESYKGPKKVVGVFLSAAYMVSKGNLLMSSARLWWTSLCKVIRNVTIGVTPTKEQISVAGNSCSICHDEFKTPVLLECTHIFCEMCVCKWLDREQTCPLCRAKIVDDPSWRDGSTTFFIQVF